MMAAESLAEEVGVNQACGAMDVPRASFYRQRKRRAEPVGDSMAKRCSPRALAAEEREQVRQTLYSERFMDKSPRSE